MRSSLKYALLMLLFLATVLAVRAESGDDDTLDTLSDADRAAEEAAAMGVKQQAEDEEDEDGGDALDEDADAARPHPDRHPLSSLPDAAHDVTVGHTFVTGGLVSSGTALTLGEEVRVLLALANNGRPRYHVWGVCGSLNAARRFSMHVQNFSYTFVNASVPSGEELSMEYSFVPNERLDTRDFQLALTVFYEAQSSDGSALRGHSSTFYNATVSAHAGPQRVSNALFLVLSALFLLACGAVAALLLKPSGGDEKGTTAASAESSSNDWLEEHRNTMQVGGGRTKASKRR